MGKKKFNKADGQKFYLLHRSQTDAAYAGDERPSDFVLVPATDNGNEVRKQQQETKAEASRLHGQKDHVTAMGFNNDGYDYSQHMKVMGGGNFIGKDGGSRPNAGNMLELPADALPSLGELDRRLEAVTISHELMDDDLRAALFNEDDGDGEFEELLDNFITDAMMEPEVPDFDFDAHIAELIARSERNTQRNAVGPRGWENDQALMGKGRMKRDNEEDDDDSDGEYPDMDGWEEADDEDLSDDDTSHNASNRRGKKSAHRSSNLNDLNFEKTLEGYDEKEIGYLSEAEEEDLQGGIELDGDNLLFNQAIDEFIQDKKDHILAEGVTVKKGARALEDDVASESVNLKEEVKEQRMRQIAGQLELEEFDEINDTHQGILTCQSYLAEERPEEQWDCESIISTYSTLDNHPSVIKDPASSRFKPYKSRFLRAAEAQTAVYNTGSSVFSGTSETGSVSTYSVSGYQSMMSMTSNDKVEMGVRVGMISPQHVPQKPSLIVLKGKMGLPEGFGPLKPYQRLLAKSQGEEGSVGEGEGDGDADASVLLTSDSLSKLSIATAKAEKEKRNINKSKFKFKGGRLGRVKEGEEENSDDDADVGNNANGDDEDDDDDSDYEEEETETVNTTASLMRMRGETPEQRKARKTLVKVEKQARRLMKKQMKNAYKEEENRQNGIVGRQQAINNVGVFKYTM